jgi:hypothetical protein
MFVIAQKGQQIHRAPLSLWKTSNGRRVKIRYPNDFSNSETVDRYATVVVTENYTTVFRKILMLPFRTWMTHNNTCYQQTVTPSKLGDIGHVLIGMEALCLARISLGGPCENKIWAKYLLPNELDYTNRAVASVTARR